MIQIKRTSLLTAIGLTLVIPPLSASAASPSDSGPITRGQFIKQIADELQLTPVNKQSILPSDVSSESPYADTVRVMQERQVLQGYSDGLFKLNQAISPEEASFILGRFLGLSDSKASSKLQADFAVDFGKDKGITSEKAGAAIKKALATDTSIPKWLAENPASQIELKTFRAHIDMNMNIFFLPNAGYPMNSLQTETKSEISFNKDQGIHQTILSTSPDSDLVTRTVKIEQYTVTQGTYMSMPTPNNNAVEWYNLSKQMPFTFDQLIELQKKSLNVNKSLVTPYFFYKDLGSAEKDGKKQRKISIQGKLANTADIIKTLDGLGGSQVSFKEILNSPAIKGMSVSLSAVVTLDEQTKLPINMDSDYIITYGEDPNIPIDRMDMTMSMAYKDVNQPVEIVLPEEAKTAKPFSLPMP